MAEPSREDELVGILHDRLAEATLEALSVDELSVDGSLDAVQEMLRIVILAGGLGTRLAPYTSVLPKPLLPVGGRPIIEILLAQLEAAGFRRVSLCVGYLAHLIRAVLDQGEPRALDIEYIHEKERFGTAGPLHLVPGLTEPFIAMNGDILTTMDFSQLIRHHRANDNVLTIATHKRKTKLDYGVLRFSDDVSCAIQLRSFHEKPELTMTVSMGIYLIEPEVLDYIPRGEPFDIPDLVQKLLRNGQPVGGYQFDGFWLDIGRPDDYEEANRVWDALEPLLLK